MPESHASARRPSGEQARRPSGELEASVLAALWAADGRPLTPADVQRDLVAALGADLARTTVTTILARLHDKGAVSRTRAGRGYAYLPAQDPPGLAARRMRSELDKSAEGLRGTVLARFVSELEPADEELLRSLLGQADAGGLARAESGGAAPAASGTAPADTPGLVGESGTGVARGGVAGYGSAKGGADTAGRAGPGGDGSRGGGRGVGEQRGGGGA